VCSDCLILCAFFDKLQQAFPDPNDYSAFMGNFSSAMGSVTLVMMLIGRSVFQRFGWKTAALVTPTVRLDLELMRVVALMRNFLLLFHNLILTYVSHSSAKYR